MLILVRHAMPAHGPDVADRDWHLTAEGAHAARELCARLPRDAYLVASTEMKAIETIAPAGPVLSDPRFDEHTGATDRPVVVATHGMTLTLWLTATIGLGDPGAFWAGLGLPDALVVDRVARTVTALPG